MAPLATSAADELVLPDELTFNRPEYGWASSIAFHAAQRKWLVDRGVHPGDWNALSPVLVASQRAHARRVGAACP